MTGNNMAEDKQQVLPEQRKALRIMLLGKSGAGKSSSGNTILGREVFKADMKLKRVTVECEKASVTISDTPVDVIDTPGFFETDRDMEEAVRDILKRVKLQEGGPHAFVHVIPLGRLTQEDQETNKLIEARFGESVWDYTIVLFTHGDCLEGKTINDVITEGDESLRNFIRKCSGGFHVFNNKKKDPKQVEVLLSKVQTLVALNGGGHYHTALYPRKERNIRETQEKILAERENEISREERNLRERYQGEDLEKERMELWHKEEKNARQKAENPATNWLMIFVILLLAFGVIAICVLLGPIGLAVGLVGLGLLVYKPMFAQRA